MLDRPLRHNFLPFANSFVTRVRAAVAGITLEQGLERRADNFLLIRIVAAAMVIYGHAGHLSQGSHPKDIFLRWGWHIYSGDIAVDSFFLISGFLVTGSWLRKRSLLSFAKARFLRLMPGYVALLLLLAFAYGSALTILPLPEYLTHKDTGGFVTRNLRLGTTMAWDLPGVFAQGMKVRTIDGSLWTLPAEARMYVYLGLLGALSLLGSRAVVLGLAAVLVTIGVAHPHWIPLPDSYLRLAGYFLLGTVAYAWRSQLRISAPAVFSLIALATLSNSTALYQILFPLALTATVFALAYLTPPLPAIDRLGDPSYGIYLWGWPVQQLLVFNFPSMGIALHITVAIMLAALIGYLSWHLVEKPAMSWKSSRRVTAVAAG